MLIRLWRALPVACQEQCLLREHHIEDDVLHIPPCQQGFTINWFRNKRGLKLHSFSFWLTSGIRSLFVWL